MLEVFLFFLKSMIKKKNYFYIFLIACFFNLFAGSCKPKNEPIEKNNERIIVVSIPPLKLILDEIIGDNFTIKSIITSDISPHIYEPIPSDLLQLENAELVFFIDENFDG